MKPVVQIVNHGKRDKNYKQRWGRVIADSQTLSRLLLAPVLIILHGKSRFPECFFIMLWIGLSDILDGLAARKFGSPAVYGAFLDAGVDFAALFTICFYYWISGSYPVFLLIGMVFSFGLFIFINLRKKIFIKSRIGKYSGAVLYFGLTIRMAARAFFPKFPAAADGIAVYLSITVLTVSIAENLIQLFRWRYTPKGAVIGR